MTEEVIQLMLSLVGCSMFGTPLTAEQRTACTMETCQAVMKLADKHDLKHLVADALLKQNLMMEQAPRLQKAVGVAIYRRQRLTYAAGQVAQILEEANIPFLPLKGAVMGKKYPQPWMRTSCDLDVLVHPADLDRAVDALVTRGGFENQGRGYHDVSLKAPNDAHVELHFSLLEDGRFPKAEAIVEAVWEHTAPVGAGMEYAMTQEMYLFHHVLHMANHICEGGCGIRSFLDLWLQRDAWKSGEALLEAGGLKTFAQTAEALASVWFDGEAHRVQTQNLEHYVLRGGVFGTEGNQAAIHQARSEGHPFLSRIFLPTEILRGHYPVLERYGWLMPFCQVARWFRLLSPKRMQRAVKLVKANTRATDSQLDRAASLLRDLGLQ